MNFNVVSYNTSLFFFLLLVIAGKVTSVTVGPRGSATVEVFLIKAYKTGSLNIAKSGPVMSVTLQSTCKRCPGLTKSNSPFAFVWYVLL